MARSVMTVLLAFMAVTSVWAFKGSGTEKDPYIIEKGEDWAHISWMISTEDTRPNYIRAYYKLADDFDNSSDPTTYMIGYQTYFSGHIDGNGKTLYVNTMAANGVTGVAPIWGINGAVIENLNVVGTVNGKGDHAAGLAGFVKGGCMIRNCNINVEVKNASYSGGIVGHAGSSELGLENCVFSGSISGFSNVAGGLVGWCENAHILMHNCMFIGSFSPGKNGVYDPILCRWNKSNPNCELSKMYYNHNYPATASSINTVANISATAVSATYVAGEWTKEMTVAGVKVYGVTPPLNGAGTSESPFIIHDALEWEKFAVDVNKGINTDKYYKLSYIYDNSRTITMPVGTNDHPFAGHFDGKGQAVSIKITGSDKFTSLFRKIDGATIENLTVSGSVEGSAYHVSGFVGECGNTSPNVIRGCVVNTKVNGGDYVGGIVGHGGSGTLTIENCVSNAELNFGGKFAGGIVGWCDELKMTISNCLFKGTMKSSSGQYHPIACRTADKSPSATLDATYYLNTSAPTAPAKNCVSGADGVAVNGAFVAGQWTSKVWAVDGIAYFQAGNGGNVSFADGTADVDKWEITPSESIEGGANVALAYSGTKAVRSIVAKYVWDGDLSVVRSDYVAQNGDVLRGKLGANVKISIADGATVTLKDVTIQGVNWSSCKWAGITCEGDATIILEGTSNVSGFMYDYPCISVPKDKTLTIKGNGKLVAKGYSAAGIGGGRNMDCGNIVIEGGIIDAKGGRSESAGIGGGGGQGTTCGDITIKGGVVNAKSDSWGAGIGGGKFGNCGTIRIEGGYINTNGNYGAGIGSGQQGGCEEIIISGGIINASGNYDCPGIGGGYYASCGDITIKGGTVTATGGIQAPGIGSGQYGSCGDITITNQMKRVVSRKGNLAPYCLGSGDGGSCGTITIDGVEYDPVEGAEIRLEKASAEYWAEEDLPVVPQSGEFSRVMPVDVEFTGTKGSYTLVMPSLYDVTLTVDYDESESVGIDAPQTTSDSLTADGAWYTLQGVKLEGEPTAPGVYVKDGKKVMVK